MARIGILGAGAWGTALACLCARNGHETVLWGIDGAVLREIDQKQTNSSFLPEVPLPRFKTTESVAVVMAQDVIIEAVPVAALREVLSLIFPYANKHHMYVVTSKGVEEENSLFSSQLLSLMCSTDKVVALSGPTFAKEIALERKSAAVLAGKKELTSIVFSLLASPFFYLEQSEDIIGVQACGAYKNPMALLIGCASARESGPNERALLFTLCLQELEKYVQAVGGNISTFKTVAGVGDLWLTCTSEQSKNYRLGTALGKGKNYPEALALFPVAPEAANSVLAIKKQLKNLEGQFPIIETLHALITEKIKADQLFEAIYRRFILFSGQAEHQK